jgi:hypothetical protein
MGLMVFGSQRLARCGVGPCLVQIRKVRHKVTCCLPEFTQGIAGRADVRTRQATQFWKLQVVAQGLF